MVLKNVNKIKNKLSNKIPKHVTVFARTTHKSQIWIKEVQREMKWMSGDNVYHLLRAVLQSLRDQLSAHEAAHFAAQLPLLLRGTFYEGWNPKSKLSPSISKINFLELVKEKLNPMGVQNFELEKGVLITLTVIKRHISVGEMKDLTSLLNPDLKNFIESNVQH